MAPSLVGLVGVVMQVMRLTKVMVVCVGRAHRHKQQCDLLNCIHPSVPSSLVSYRALCEFCLNILQCAALCRAGGYAYCRAVCREILVTYDDTMAPPSYLLPCW